MTHASHNPRQGSVLGAALIMALAIAIIFAGLIQWSNHEREITMRHVALAKARMTAESVGEYGEAQVIARLERLTYFADDEFMPSVRPPVLPGEKGNSTLVHALLEAKALSGLKGGIGQSVSALAGKKSSSSTTTTSTPSSPSSTSTTPPGDTGFFRYEMAPEQLVVGRFDAGRWQRMDGTNPLYVGDPLIDQTVRVREVQMVSAARAVDSRRGTTLRAFCEYRLQVRDAPVWGNMMFYNMDLEIAPGPAMEVHGPVHANGKLYVQSGGGLNFFNTVTSAGEFYYGRTTGTADNTGDVSFRKAGTTSELVSLKQAGSWLDSRTPDWTAKASTLWAGNVRSREHGINPALMAGVAPYVPDNPSTPANELQNTAHVVIEPALPESHANFPGIEVEIQKFASKACLVLEVSSSGTVSLYKYSASTSGTYLRTTASGTQKFIRQELTVPPGLVVGGAASDKFFDRRRGQWIASTDVDVGKLKSLIETAGEAVAFTNGGVTFDPATEWNGVVYVANAQTALGGVRLVNGGSIPDRATFANGYTRGFTLATDAPLYVQGNFNANGDIANDGSLIRNPDSTSEPPAGLAADAVTILSKAWSDANSDKALSSRVAQQTEVAAALLLGIVPTNKNNNGIYSGGVENLPRFLENWSGVKFGYRGSLVVLYESTRATEPWGSSNVYSPPNRVWGFNKLFADGVHPPGTPSSRTYRRVGFRDLSAAEYQTALASIGQ